MARRYTLDTKIDALNQLDQLDGDILLGSETLKIPVGTLRDWLRHEDDLRRSHRDKQERHLSRLKAELQTTMLEKGLDIVARMDDETLDKAPLNQLATALGALVNHALKLEEDIDDNHEQEEKEHIVRFEYYYEGEVHDAPPWARDRNESSGTFQDSSVRETLGENTSSEAHRTNGDLRARSAWLVVDPNSSDGDSGMAGMEEYLENDSERDWYHD